MLFIFFLVPFLSLAQGRQITLVIDPGHGGNDPGHLSEDRNHLPEKDLNLKIAKYLGSYIELYMQNVKVIYTRTTDTYPSLDERVAVANNNRADYFLSIHCNGNERKNVRGTESHVHAMSLGRSVQLARNIEAQFSKRAGRKSRGVKDEHDLQHSLQVLKYTNMPSVLVECGFVTNKREADFLNSTYGQEIIASAIFRAFRGTLETNYPDIAFRRTTPSTNSSASSGNGFGIQIASSKAPIATDDSYFKKAKLTIERKELNTKSPYKYIYIAGRFASKEEANEALSQIRKRGFKDAFVVTL